MAARRPSACARTSDGSEIVRGDNRDKSGINGDFLCNKGRYAFDFANNEDRITQPLVRQPNGELKPVSWEVALDHVGKKLRERRDTRGGKSIGVIGCEPHHQRRGLPPAEVRPHGARHQQHRSPPHRGLRLLRPGARRHKRTAPLPCATP